MAEDQSVNGDIWNKEAAKLLSLFSWEKIGDHNMDLEGDDDDKYGVDTILRFNNPSSNLPQSIILEAKRYATTSFQKNMLQKWINRLDKKIRKLRNSENFLDMFPEIKQSSTLNLGIIAIWFHDYANYNSNLLGFNEVKLSSRVKKDSTYNKICVIDNPAILRLCSMQRAIEDFERTNNCDIHFYYPSPLINDRPIQRSKTLSVDYMFSKIVLAESVSRESKREEKIVFYFGDLNIHSFESIKSLLSGFLFIDKEKPLTIFIYSRDDEFRKIQSNIESRFDEIDFKIKYMEIYEDLPAIIKNLE